MKRLLFATTVAGALTGAAGPAPAQDSAAPDPAESPAPAAKSAGSPARAAREKFRWPLRGPILQPFKPGESDGIDIKAPVGEPVHAAADGVCAYAGNELKTFGNLILLRHANGYVTAYAHLREVQVKEDDSVRRGQIIGKAGDTGETPSPRLHFELRKDGKAIDPTKFLVPL